METHMVVYVVIISLIWRVNAKTNVDVGVILDMETSFGKMIKSSILLAIHDFYEKHGNFTTMISPHFRDSKLDNVEALSAAIDLMKNVQVKAILGPMYSSQADFVIDIGKNAKVPIISPATSPALSPHYNSYFIRTAPDASFQLKPIAELIKHFSWREVVLIYEDDEYGRALVPYLADVMLKINTKIMSQTAIYPSASDDRILETLYKLKMMQTRVFVVHALPDLASRFFRKVYEAGMMEEGYVWIITEALTSRLHSLHPKDIELMQGVLGVKSYIFRSNNLISFEKRWKREFLRVNPKDEVTELDIFGIWAYDTVFALAMALEKVSSEANTTFRREIMESSTDLNAIGTSELGPTLVPWIRNASFKGLGGKFHVVNGQLQWSEYQVVNIIGKLDNPIGSWTPKDGMLKKLDNQTKGLKAIIWPGDTHEIPKGWEIPISNVNKLTSVGNEKELKVGIPARAAGVPIFVDSIMDPQTKKFIATGFCIDVFHAVINALPYAVKFEFIPFVTPDGMRPAGSYNDLLRKLSYGEYDVVVGDITILASRSEYVDFTSPYTEAGTAMIVRIKDDRKSAWIFMKPLEKQLWITIGAFFIYTGLVVWVLERRVNEEFRGSPYQQLGMIFWFSFSTLVFAQREKLMSNLSRFVVILWVFVVLVLTASYTASLTSMLTIQQLQSTDIYQIMRKGESVGYQDGSFIRDMLKTIGFDGNKLKNYSTFEQYDDALQKGSQNGGVSAIMDEIPYIRVFLAKYCTKYNMTGYINNTAGFGFAFPKGSPLVQDFSTVLQEKHQIADIFNDLLGPTTNCEQKNETTLEPNRLMLDSFKGLFLIYAFSSTTALLFFFFMVLYQNREILVSQDSITQKIVVIAKTFNEFKDYKSKKTSAEEAVDEPGSEDNINNSPTISVHHPEAGVLSPGEGTSSTEPGTPVRDSIQGLSTTELMTPDPDTNGIQVVETTTQN